MAPRCIGFLVFDDFQLLDAAGPIAAFEMPSRMVSPSPYELQVLALVAGPVRSSSGFSLDAAALSEAGPLDTLVVVGGWGTITAVDDAALIEQLRAIAPRVRRLCAVCSGAFLLAEAGLLDGRRATTHWRRAPGFAKRYPKVRAEADRIFVRDGHVWTSAGISAGIDLSLALIEDDLGAAVARRAAQELVVYHRRPGGQSQFSALLELGGGDSRFADLIGWMRENLAAPLTVEQLADQAGMSPRNFARAFKAETGGTPAKAVERLRLEAARDKVENAATSLDVVAQATGFGDVERMRGAFLRAYGQPPQALRRLARASPPDHAPSADSVEV